MVTLSLFKTPEGAIEYQAAYNAALALWPVPHDELDVTTSYGITHINVAGSVELPPLVLLHGFAVCSTQWYPNIEPLSQYFRVFAVDVPGQMNLSTATRPLKTRQDCAAWLIELLDALKIDQASFAGHSYGGWLTLNLAAIAPQRVLQMVLLSPAAGVESISLSFMLRFLSAVFIPRRAMIYGFMQSCTTMQLTDGNLVVEQLVIGIKHFDGKHIGSPVIYKFTDAELRQIIIPTLILVGDQDASCNPNRVITRTQKLIPGVEAELVVGGGHLFPTDQAEQTNSRMLKFLNHT